MLLVTHKRFIIVCVTCHRDITVVSDSDYNVLASDERNKSAYIPDYDCEQ